MSTDYTQVLLPPSLVAKEKPTLLTIKRTPTALWVKWTAATALVVTITLLIGSTFLAVRYEERTTEVELRLKELEGDIDAFFEVLKEELEVDYQRPSPALGESNEFLVRSKRQSRTPMSSNRLVRRWTALQTVCLF